ncbi:MAG: sugar phosphate isomerase/epimerase, partial [Mesorhizobium sp.]
MMPNPLLDIRIGTMVRANLDDPAVYVKQILPLGFESIQPFFWQTLGGKDLKRLAGEIREAIGDADVAVSSIGVFGNPLENGEVDRGVLAAWETVIDNAHLFGTTMVCGFTGRLRGKPLTDSLPRFREVWGPLARRAADKGVRIAFENCAMDGNWASGDWNIAHNPDAWELMFNELPDDNLGLEWEPCHQLVYLIDPIPQIRKWAPRIFHVHGKDATVRWDVIREHGVFGRLPFVQM